MMERFVSSEPVEKGWSGDRKYHVSSADGTGYLLRISPADKKEKVSGCFRMQQAAAELGIPMCLPIETGDCGEGVYVLQSWIDGRDAGEVIPQFAPEEQYGYGIRAGRILALIHTIPAPGPHGENSAVLVLWQPEIDSI